MIPDCSTRVPELGGEGTLVTGGIFKRSGWQMLENAIDVGRGGVFLKMTPEQSKRLGS